MPSKQQSTGMTGLYLVAAELSTRGFIVSPTSRSAQAADLLVTDTACKHTFAVQVKTNASTFSFWLVGAKASELVSQNFMYALVNLKPGGPEFFLVPSAEVSANVVVERSKSLKASVWHSVYRKAILEYREKWEVFGNSKPAYNIYRGAPLVHAEPDLLAKSRHLT